MLPSSQRDSLPFSLHLTPCSPTPFIFLFFSNFDSAWKKQPCLGSLSAGALEAGVEGATALALPSVVALEEVAAEAGAATARSLCPGDLEVVDVVEALAARVSIT